MSTQVTAGTLSRPAVDREAGHRLRILAGWLVAFAFLAVITLYGFDYYLLDALNRPLSPKHPLLKPSGTIGLRLGILGVLLFLVIYCYALRKRWAWLGRQGSSRHWLDYHIILGVAAPLVIAFHAAFKYRGIAGMAFWIMVAVALSGIVGRYLYAQIPRSLNAAEISLKELQSQQEQLKANLASQKLFSNALRDSFVRLPSVPEARQMPLLKAIAVMLAIDFELTFLAAKLRRRAGGRGQALLTLGGFLSSGNEELEAVVRTLRQQVTLSKRIVFLSRSQQVFHLWHVVHRPFSYAFAVLACIHILVVVLFRYAS
jgi:hypothetical protein